MWRHPCSERSIPVQRAWLYAICGCAAVPPAPVSVCAASPAWRFHRRAIRGVKRRLHQYAGACGRSEEHTSELQSLMRISYAVFCLKKKKQKQKTPYNKLFAHIANTKSKDQTITKK